MTKGAVYSSFDNKADLFYALMRERVSERLELVTRQVETVSGTEGLDQLGTNIGAVFRDLLLEQREWQLMYVEFWAVAARNPRLKQSLAEHRREFRRLIGTFIERVAEERNAELPIRGDLLAAIVLGLVNGIAMEQIADPEQLDPELLVEGLQIFLRGLPSTSS